MPVRAQDRDTRTLPPPGPSQILGIRVSPATLELPPVFAQVRTDPGLRLCTGNDSQDRNGGSEQLEESR